MVDILSVFLVGNFRIANLGISSNCVLSLLPFQKSNFGITEDVWKMVVMLMAHSYY